MPNLRSCYLDVNPATLDDVVLSLVASDGCVFTLTARDKFQSLGGGLAARAGGTLQWVRDSISEALGPEQVPGDLIDLDWDDVKLGLRGVGFRGAD